MRRANFLFAIAVTASSVGCPSTNPVECRDNTSCDLSPGGVCTVATGGNQWCAYPDPACPGGLRYSDFHTGDGLAGTCVTAAADAGVDATDATTDAMPGMWSAPESLDLNTPTQAETSAGVTPDGLQLYFAAPQGAGTFILDIFYVTRTGTSFAWGANRTAVGAINSAQSEAGPCVSADGLELYFVRGGSIYVSRRLTAGSAWGAPTATGLDGVGPDILADGRVMYYQGDAVSCPVDTCRVKVTRPDAVTPWGNPVVEPINDGGTYQLVDISGDGLRALLSAPSNAAIVKTAITTRPNRNAPWGTPVPIAELAIYTGIIWAQWSWDEREMYLGFLSGANDIYISHLR